ncbi:MAG: FeoA domain-containing protein [Desulfobacteraceae bacterium]|nr:FeoA domain-containing protein [Desulfobacteraceae bacterium]
MKQLHLQEKEQFQILFRQENIDRFEDRFRVLEVFLANEGHLTVDEISRLLRDQGDHFDAAFVAETLELMCQFGFARKNRFENGKMRYEHRHLGQHHDHMICTKCGKISEFHNQALETLQKGIADGHGFHMLQHRMEIYGICNGCMQERIDRIPLSMARQGESLTLSSFIGGTGSRIRLMSMGLRPGDVLEVISNLSQGQVVVAAGDKRYVLGKGLAEKIQVSRTTQTEAAPPAAQEVVAGGGSMPMSEMREGQKGVIFRVGGNGSLRRRLLEMGLVKGTSVFVEKYAPLRDPLELIVKGYHVSLRVEEAAHIQVDHVS